MQVINQTQIIPLINKLMEQIGMTRKEMGEITGTSQPYVSKILNSKDTEYIKTKIKFLKKLGVNADYKKEIKVFIK